MIYAMQFCTQNVLIPLFTNVIRAYIIFTCTTVVYLHMHIAYLPLYDTVLMGIHLGFDAHAADEASPKLLQPTTDARHVECQRNFNLATYEWPKLLRLTVLTRPC